MRVWCLASRRLQYALCWELHPKNGPQDLAGLSPSTPTYLKITEVQVYFSLEVFCISHCWGRSQVNPTTTKADNATLWVVSSGEISHLIQRLENKDWFSLGPLREKKLQRRKEMCEYMGRWKRLGCETLLVHDATFTSERKRQSQLQRHFDCYSGVNPQKNSSQPPWWHSHFTGMDPPHPNQSEAGVNQGEGWCLLNAASGLSVS